MKAQRLIRFGLITVLLLMAETVSAQTIACPAGQAAQGVNFATRRVVCVRVVSPAELATERRKLNSAISALQVALATETAARQAADGALQTAIAALQTGNALVQALVPHLSVVREPLDGVAGPHIVFEGANVHVRSGSGATNDSGTLTGLGNLIVGYNEPRFGDDTTFRTGSHNLIVGPMHQYPAAAGFLAGFNNTASGDFASVSGGQQNTASSDHASVSGGIANTASGFYASVSGGWGNTASGPFASVSGGQHNTASGNYASVSGGFTNTASGHFASVSGGDLRTAAGGFDWVAGALFEDE